jgi:hypothetical protein
MPVLALRYAVCAASAAFMGLWEGFKGWLKYARATRPVVF